MRIFVPQSTDVLDLYGLLISTETHYLQLLSSNNRNTTGGRDLINFKNTHGDKQGTENKSAQPCPPSPPSLSPSICYSWVFACCRQWLRSTEGSILG